MTALYIATNGSRQERKTFESYHRLEEVNILISFWYLENALKSYPDLLPRFKSRMLDSGAFSAWNKGVEIDIDALIVEAKNPRWDETVALDVVSSAGQSLANALKMKAAGADAMPVFHFGEPFEFLEEYKRNFDKIGLSCRFGEADSESLRWIERCFKTAYPHKFHSFGWIHRKMLTRFCFHSADCSSWNMPMRWAQWRGVGMKNFNGRLTAKNIFLHSELNFYLDLQNYLSARWKKELSRWT